ncbi:unnamed protein product [Schistocephalus solidus]|uniref:MAM domain-containing protein n=1 Tax=Schistocephalus solidus TaxID=70667 RepID=A0A183T390_SCHSO|nr:unnamed protein product [Schistocephalus solidus]
MGASLEDDAPVWTARFFKGQTATGAPVHEDARGSAFNMCTMYSHYIPTDIDMEFSVVSIWLRFVHLHLILHAEGQVEVRAAGIEKFNAARPLPLWFSAQSSANRKLWTLTFQPKLSGFMSA